MTEQHAVLIGGTNAGMTVLVDTNHPYLQLCTRAAILSHKLDVFNPAATVDVEVYLRTLWVSGGKDIIMYRIDSMLEDAVLPELLRCYAGSRRVKS